MTGVADRIPWPQPLYVTVDGDVSLRRVTRRHGRVDVVPAERPNVPELVGVTRAAEILGISKGNVERLRQQDRMPEAIEVEGVKRPTPVYVKAEVEALARELEAERDQRDG